MSGRNHDFEMGWRAQKESYGSLLPDAEVSFEMEAGK
jgi:hypothetical protein